MNGDVSSATGHEKSSHPENVELRHISDHHRPYNSVETASGPAPHGPAHTDPRTSHVMTTVHPVHPVHVRMDGNNPAHVTNTNGAVSDDDTDGITLTAEALSPLLSTNQFTVRKMAAQGLMDVALLMANISQLRTLITGGPDLEYFYILICLVGFSLVAQILFAIIMFVVWMRETEDNYREEFLQTIREVAASKDPAAKVARQGIKLDKAKQEEKLRRHEATNRLNYFTIVLVFIITVTNMFITGFGIKLETNPTPPNTPTAG